ncbi:hypothetical protein DRN74_00180 [Candidatus Micrarchaeota archaeon]|mgnify:CR=1 FL=1|nr:MAG: hypothetical protein DRN74_00180 [Candidatus Micrarchaeota archaeon]
MNKGFTVVPMIIIALIFLVIIGLGVALIVKIPILNIMFRFYMLIIIYTFVRRIVGTGILAYVITAILAYIFVWKLWVMAAGVYLSYIIFSFGISGIIIFGLEGMWRRGGGEVAEEAAKRLA